MKTPLLIFFLILSASANAQQWCPPGSQWNYNYFASFIGYGLGHCNYEKDTIVASQSCKKITCIDVVWESLAPGYSRIDTYSRNPIYTFARNDSVFFLVRDTFTPYYFFNAHVGDTISYHGMDYCTPPDNITTLVIDSTGTMQINDSTLRFYVASYIGDGHFPVYPSSVKVVERLGPVDNYMIPSFYCVTDADGYTFRCYKDDSFAVYQYDPETPCDYLYTGLNYIEQNEVSLFPNPATNSCQLKLSQTPNTETYFELFDAVGQLVKRERVTDINTTISRNTLNNGIYFWQLESTNTINARGKIIFE